MNFAVTNSAASLPAKRVINNRVRSTEFTHQEPLL